MTWTEAFELNYEEQTTFWMDFSIADRFGVNAIKDTFNRALNEWKNNKVYATELVMVLNCKCWYHYNRNNKYSELYSELYYQAKDVVCETLKGEDLEYFYRTTD